MSDKHDDPSTEQHSPGELLDELGSLKELLDEEHESALPYTSVNEISSVEDYLQLKQQADSAGMDVEEYLHQQAEPQAEEHTVEGLELLDDDDDAIPLLDEVYFIEEESEEDGDALLREVAEEEEMHAPSTDEATTVEEYFAAVAAKRPPVVEQEVAPLLDEVVASEEPIPVLDEVFSAEEPIPVLDEVFSTEEAIPVLDEVFSVEEAIPVLDELAPDSATDAEEVMSLDEMQQLVDLIVSRKLDHIKADLEKEVMSELQKLLPPSTFTKP